MTEMQAKRNNGASQQAQYDFNATQAHLEALNHRLVELLGDKYAIQLDEPADFELEDEPFIRYPIRCVYYTHNDKHYDENPSGWIAVSQKDGHLISGCWVCDRPQIVKHGGEYQPAPTLLTLSRNDKRLLKTLLDFGCEEVTEVNEKEQPAVAFPVTYADGSEGFHYRVALEGRDKWLHQKGGKASQAVFGLYKPEIQAGIREAGYVVITESPPDALVLITARFPSISGCGKGNTPKALACDQHKETLLGLLGDNGVVYVWVEPDAKDFAQRVANALQRPVKVIYPPDYAKDAYRLWLACGKDWDRFRGEIVRLTQNTTEIAPQPEPVQVTEPTSEFDSQDTIIKVTFPLQIRKKVTDIQPLEFEWLVEEYIPIGVVTLLAGAGGYGKTSLLCDLAASIVKGGKWLNKFEVPQGGVILIVTEDPAGIRDKLFSYGVNSEDDPLLIYDLTEWEEESEEEYKPIKAAKALPAILQDAKEVLGNIPIRLVGLDCLRGFGFDEAQASRKKKSDRLPTVREIYKPLAKFAEKEGCAVIVTHHFRKLQTEDLKSLKPKRKKGKEVAPEIDKDLLVSLVAGTAETVNAARQALVVIGDKEAGVGIIVPVKSNRSVVLGAPIRYDFYAENPTFLEFLEEGETAIETAIAFLRRVLSQGEIPSNELLAQAKKEGISNSTYWRARKRLDVKAKRVYVDGKQIWVAYLPNQTDQADHQPNPLPNSDPLAARPEPDMQATETPPDQPTGQAEPERPDSNPQVNGSLPTKSVDDTNYDSLGSVGEKPKQNLEFCSLPTEKAFDSLDSLGREPDSVEDYQDYQASNHWQTTLIDLKSPINTSVSEQDYQDYQTSGNLEARPKGDPLVTETEPDPQGSPPSACGNLIYSNKLGLPDDSPEPDPQPTDPLNEEWLWNWFMPERLKPSARADQPEPTESPTEPEGSLTLNEPEEIPQEAQTEPNLQANEPEVSPPDQPVATLNEPVCPICGIELEPEPDSGLAACLGCGRLFKVEIPPTSPEGDDSDDNPPISPDGDGGNPPNPQGNGHGGSQTGFAPPKTLSIPPVFPSANRIYSNKFNSPAILNRMTKRLPDGSIKLVWDDKTETVTPADLAGWQHIEEIPEVDLQDIESVEIPPVVVLDLETKGKDPQHGHILAVGLALFVAGKEVETQIFHNEGDEAALLFQVFDYLRETCDSLGDFILTGYNMFDFDLRFLIERSRRLRMKRACPFDYERDENGNIKRLPIPDTHGKYKYTAIKTTLPIMLIDTQHLVIRWDEFERVLTDYSLKSVAEHFGVNIPNRPKPTPEQIVHAFYHNRPLFDAYLLADLRETYAVFDILIEPYLGIAAFTGLDLEDLARKNGRGWVWEQHYERHYTEIPEADKTRKYKGGLVVCRKGLWFNCAKFDIASLYPTIALAYRIHSRKDPLQIGLRYLKTYTMKRLELKQKARETGDRSAQTLQSGLKVLINSYYGYFGSEYNFNDIEAAERVTEIGRKILTCMIAAVEDLGLLVVEADTDGIIVACQDRDPQEVLQVISDAIPPVFKVELERQGAVVFVSEMKNYMVFEPNGDLIEVKGGNWRGRDKPAFQTEAIPEFMKRWITQGVEAALDYARKVWAEIQSGNGWRWVVRTRRVGRGDKTLMQAGFKVGEKATYAYKNYKRREIALKPDEGYDQKYYADEFSDLVKKVIAAIDPAQIAAWERMVKQEARPLIFAG